MYKKLIKNYTVRELIHSHPDISTGIYGPSGFLPQDENDGDRRLAEWKNTYFPKSGVKLKVYAVPIKKYIEYNHNGIVK
ncbi:MAG: hypothetical protein DWQ44_09160 [Bacteroidetes bacterium]|nr:MAG: hypothetical protein DWQ33_02615 [Bacteroidota bacterium]REK06456.1 MAG: hypothetical protein DWQ39_02950 [Bacteroidota bacterium]REK33222.1 MAG: hypothetical protein DWQ44_09160 [Bacteroidota bacterium]REK47059.1 MAG: hypothetical protein DWQ48_13495 [Bacteroidota bacterium]